MRLSEMTHADLIKQIEDDALAREVYSRLVLAEARITDREQALEHQRDKAQESYEQAMCRVSQLERDVEACRVECVRSKQRVKHLILASPGVKVAIHSSILDRDVSRVTLHWTTERRHGYEGIFLCVAAIES